MEAAKRGVPAVTVCSTEFTGLGRAQARALGYPDLPIAVIPHPFGVLKRDQVAQLAERCADDIARLLCEGPGTLLPISVRPEDIGILVAGGSGTHSVYLPVSGHVHAVTREIVT